MLIPYLLTNSEICFFIIYSHANGEGIEQSKDREVPLGNLPLLYRNHLISVPNRHERHVRKGYTDIQDNAVQV